MKERNKLSKENDVLTIRTLLALFLTDIDIFLLMEEDQETDKNKLYEAFEIRNQFNNSIRKTIKVLKQQGVDVDKPIQCEFILDMKQLNN